MGEKNTLIDFEGVSNVAIKLLEMIEKSIGWVVTPRGQRMDFNESVEKYKEWILNDENLAGIEKYAAYASARKDLREYINTGKIIGNSFRDIKADAHPEDIDQDWLTYFFEYAKNISDDSIQRIWGKLLAYKINGEYGITKKLINVFSLMEKSDVELFCMLCAMTCDNLSNSDGQYPFVYIRRFPAYYNKYGIRRYNLAQLDNLGLIEYDSHGNFVLPTSVPILKYGNSKIYLEADNRVSNGNIRFTQVGQALYRITKSEILDDFLENCKKIWNKMDIKYKIEEDI